MDFNIQTYKLFLAICALFLGYFDGVREIFFTWIKVRWSPDGNG